VQPHALAIPGAAPRSARPDQVAGLESAQPPGAARRPLGVPRRFPAELKFRYEAAARRPSKARRPQVAVGSAHFVRPGGHPEAARHRVGVQRRFLAELKFRLEAAARGPSKAHRPQVAVRSAHFARQGGPPEASRRRPFLVTWRLLVGGVRSVRRSLAKPQPDLEFAARHASMLRRPEVQPHALAIHGAAPRSVRPDQVAGLESVQPVPPAVRQHLQPTD